MSNLIDQASLVMIPSGYKEDKIYSQVPTDGSGDLTFSRASDGTRVNSQGLVERVPWNLVTYSEEWNNTAEGWIIENCTVNANSEVAPNGTTTAETFTATGNFPRVRKQFTNLTDNTIYTISSYLKAGTAYVVGLNVVSKAGTDTNIQFNLSTATAGTGGTIESVGNGWFRCSMQFDSESGATTPTIRFATNAFGVTGGWTGSNTIITWGAQLNEGTTAKPYFPTTDRQNVPRLDYSNGCPSLLLEPQRTNLLTYSEQFDNAAWSKGNLNATANQTTSPDGTQNADSLSEQAVNGIHYAGQGIASASASTYTFSCFLKQGTQQYGGFRAVVNGFVNRYFVLLDLSNGSVVDTETLGTGVTWSHNVQSFANGWYRLTITAPHTIGNVDLSISPSDSASPSYFGGLPTYTGDTSKNIYAWGAQLEAGSYPTSYIPTTSASVTRVADAASKTGISSLIGQTEGTLYWEVDFGVNDTGEYPAIFLWDGTSANRMLIQRRGNTSKLQYQVVVSGVVQVDELGTTLIGSGKVKIAYAYKANDFVVYLNGSQEIVDTSGSTYSGALSQIAFQNLRHDKTSQLTLFKTRLTNAELAALTTL